MPEIPQKRNTVRTFFPPLPFFGKKTKKKLENDNTKNVNMNI